MDTADPISTTSGDEGERVLSDFQGLRAPVRVRWKSHPQGERTVWVRYYDERGAVYWSIESHFQPGVAKACFPFPFGAEGTEGTLEVATAEGKTSLFGDLPLGRDGWFQGLIAAWDEPAKTRPAAAEPARLGAAVEGVSVAAPAAPVGCADGYRAAGTVIDNPAHPLVRFLCPRRPLPPAPPDLALDFVVLARPERLAFYDLLASLRDEPDGRQKMMAAASDFAATPEFVQHVAELGTPVTEYPLLVARIAAIAGQVELAVVLESVETFLFAFGVGPLAAYLDSPYLAAVEARVWQSLFAVALGAGASPSLADGLVQVLRVDHFLRALERERTLPPTQPLCFENGREAALSATVVLPEGAVPEDSGCALPPPCPEDGWVKAVGVGDLKLVCQCLQGYRLGEVAQVVNVMPRERLETTARELEETRESAEIEGSASAHEDDLHELASRSELHGELTDVIAAEALCSSYNNLTQQYDPPTITLNGTWSGNDCAKERSDRQAEDYAQGLTRRAAVRVVHTVSASRARRRLHEHERVQARDVDNRQGAERLLGVYRWLQKTYRLSLCDAGKRLIVEFSIADPAASYLGAIRNRRGLQLTRPKPLSAEPLRIYGPADVTADNYLLAGSFYHLEDLAPPPQPVTLVATLQARPPVSEAQLTVPPGFAVTAGSVTYLLGDAADSLVGYVGAAAFSRLPPVAALPVLAAPQPPAGNGAGNGCAACDDPLSYQPPPANPVQGAQDLTSALQGTQGTLPITVLTTAASYAVSVTLTCGPLPGSDLLAAWQVRTYDALLAGYQCCLLRFEREMAARIAAESAGDKRRIERRELEKEAVEILWCRRAAIPRPSPDCADESRLLVFFERAFAWDEMTYAFHRRPPCDEPCGRDPDWPGQALIFPEADALFQSFLRAASARVLVPVRPGEELAVLYYLLFGLLWPGRQETVPAAADDVGLVADLRAPLPSAGTDCSWQVDIPTSLLVLQQGSDLPSFDCPANPCTGGPQ